MKRLVITAPATTQVKAAIAAELGICLDLTGEAMGDKITALAFAQWIRDKFDTEVYLVESEQGRTPFLLRDFPKTERLTSVVVANDESHDYLDCMGQGFNSCLWVMNPYLTSLGIRPDLGLPAVERTNEIVIVPLTNTPYDQRRNIDLDRTASLVEILRDRNQNVVILSDKPLEQFPDALNLPVGEFVNRIASAKCVVAGDTGASHLAGSLRTPLVALLPDWMRYGIYRISQTIAVQEWWGISSYFTPHSCMPNCDPDKVRLSLVDDEHKFSVAHVFDLIQSLTGKIEKPVSRIIQP